MPLDGGDGKWNKNSVVAQIGVHVPFERVKGTASAGSPLASVDNQGGRNTRTVEEDE
jgi:hypothetical protein